MDVKRLAGRMPLRVWLSLWWRRGPWIITPPPNMHRCVMGYPYGEQARCRRRLVNDGTNGELWCKKHDKELEAI